MWPVPVSTGIELDIEEITNLEVFAPICLREHFSLKDGDKITLEVVDDFDILAGFLTEEEYLNFTEKHIHEAHWKGAISRWEYHKIARDLLSQLDFETVLEAGTMGVQIYRASDTIDLDIPPDWPLYYTPTYNHNLSVLPWPIRDKQYDVFVALRVFHRFSPSYLYEMQRVAKHIILGLTKSTVDRFKQIKKPNREIECGDTVILYWKE
jgi:hypothetical protein